ncbi:MULTISPECIES: gamma-glutamyltransferase family protein [Bacillaceae]|uniref:Gamma-glutamyltransferase family protein n=1 Tax=Evansella alkalicola TaxID=745819 RepID=A0ABS6JYL0_9BACI|nr:MULTISPECIES: gamma-glutamyltransferase family protein [Bacillaceae]MBU9723683.1 gamma-glutamyltransferase family protein [Bacillus alkalicola]
MERRINSSTNSLGMVSTASKYATDAGVKMLEKGGNAFDAAAAAAICLGVTEPQASGLGGQSMALIYQKETNRVFALDGSSRAPFQVQPTKTPEKPIKLGITSSTVPSTPATIGYMQEKYGKLSLAEILEPAIIAAENGFVTTPLIHKLIKKEEQQLRKDPTVLKNYFIDNVPAPVGHVIRQPELAECLKTMAQAGWHDFYVGTLGQQIIKDMENRGGLITAADLCQIPQPIEREVLESTYRNYQIYTFPPPGAGRVLVQILNTLEGFPSEILNSEDPIGASIFALAFRFALINRQRIPIHPDYYLQTVNKMMLDKGYGRELSERIKEIYTFALQDKYSPPPHSGETTHLSVVDKEGNCVGITQSIELVFGSKTVADGLGFFYNNYMSAFEYKNMTHPYYLLPGAKPWSSVAPVLLFNNGQPRFLLGSPGSSRISTTLAQVITRVVDRGETLDKAIGAPRFHSSDTGHLQIEKKRFNSDVLDALHRTGFQLKNRGPYSFYLGCVQGIQISQNSHEPFLGVADPRRDGTAIGPTFING